jgi:hypothetical protein
MDGTDADMKIVSIEFVFWMESPYSFIFSGTSTVT